METTEATAELQENIHDEEEIRWVVRPHALARFADDLVGGLIAGLLVGGFFGYGAFAVAAGITSSAGVGVLAGGSILLLVVFLATYKPVLMYLFGTVEYAATNARLIRYERWFGEQISSVPLRGVQDTEYNISTIERLFDVGTVDVDTKRGYETISYPHAAAPTEFSREIADLASRVRNQGGTGLESLSTGEYTPSAAVTAEEPADDLEANIYPDESLLWVVTPNKKLKLLAKLPGLLIKSAFGLVFVGTIGFGIGVALTQDPLLGVATALALSVVYLLATIGPSVFVSLRKTTQYAVTDRRIIEYDGRFGKHLSSIPLAGVQDAEYSVGTIERLAGVGSVSIDTHAGFETMGFSYIDEPTPVSMEITRVAASNIAYSDAVDPGSVSVGDGIDPQSASEDLERNLSDTEQLTWVIAPDKKAKALAETISSLPGLTVVGLFFGAFLAAGVFQSTGSFLLTALVVVGVIVGIVGLAAAGQLVDLLFDKTEYALTDDRLIEYSGRFGRELSGVPIEGIQDAEYDISIVKAWFSVGDVTVDTDPDYEQVTIQAVANPADVAREVSEIANAYRVANARGTEPRTADSTSERTATSKTGSTGTSVPQAHKRKQCRKCQSAIDVSAVYCPNCGTEQPQPSRGQTTGCRECDGPADPEDQFCRFCGAQQPARGSPAR